MFLGQIPPTNRPRNAIECEMVHPAVGTFIVGWPSVTPIALDYRYNHTNFFAPIPIHSSLQAWPLTPLFGCLGGYIVGTLFAYTCRGGSPWSIPDHSHQNPRVVDASNSSKGYPVRKFSTINLISVHGDHLLTLCHIWEQSLKRGVQ
ncbi:hypothetical protein HD554DRAFT_2071862 [Boletus coccyginus]|nr:hypothetical protein HD554DRAFT_2071862 [Boletus coccyginus]